MSFTEQKWHELANILTYKKIRNIKTVAAVRHNMDSRVVLTVKRKCVSVLQHILQHGSGGETFNNFKYLISNFQSRIKIFINIKSIVDYQIYE